ncbi:hypothetical protein AAG570_005170 [Ranatra chinensis]|uniref:protein-tyrosine-phosphatase n=1 Tax=Ranatra chinensis TaxID=642074 RepID=A0ABD0YEJ7_9HEMI
MVNRKPFFFSCRSLRISTYTGGGVGGGRCLKGGGDTCSCEPKCDPPRDAPAPPAEDDSLVEILPHLFLGNAANSEDLETLTKHSIKYILNVTPDLPNVFEPTGEIKYMKIPIADHWSQNLASYFPKAIEFIGELFFQLYTTKETFLHVLLLRFQLSSYK